MGRTGRTGSGHDSEVSDDRSSQHTAQIASSTGTAQTVAANSETSAPRGSLGYAQCSSGRSFGDFLSHFTDGLMSRHKASKAESPSHLEPQSLIINDIDDDVEKLQLEAQLELLEEILRQGLGKIKLGDKAERHMKSDQASICVPRMTSIRLSASLQSGRDWIIRIGWSEISTTIFIQSPYLPKLDRITLSPPLPEEKALLENVAQTEDCSTATETRIENSRLKLKLVIKKIERLPQEYALRVICLAQRIEE